jgi:hypothetical protein
MKIGVIGAGRQGHTTYTIGDPPFEGLFVPTE